MIITAILRAPKIQPLLERMGGLTLIERQLFILARSGIQTAYVTLPAPTHPLRLPAELEVRWVADATPSNHRLPAIELSSEYLMRVDALRPLLRKKHPEPLHYLAPDGNVVLSILTDKDSPCAPQMLPRNSVVPVRTRKENADAIPWLLEGARKGGDGFMARYFDRALSLNVTHRLLDTTIKPNQMTLISTLIGLSGAVLYLRQSYKAALAGALLVWLHSVLDGCDGEIARIKFLESRWGRVLDFWGDNTVHFVLFACMGIGLYSQDHRSIALGTFACLSALGSAWLSYRLHQKSSGDTGPIVENTLLSFAPPPHPGLDAVLQRAEILLAQRDFIYLLLVTAVFHQSIWFLWAAGIGSPIYLIVLLYLCLQPTAQAQTSGLRLRPERTETEVQIAANTN